MEPSVNATPICDQDHTVEVIGGRRDITNAVGQTIARLVSPSDATAVVDKILEFLDQNGIEEYGDVGLLEMDDVNQWLADEVAKLTAQNHVQKKLIRCLFRKLEATGVFVQGEVDNTVAELLSIDLPDGKMSEMIKSEISTFFTTGSMRTLLLPLALRSADFCLSASNTSWRCCLATAPALRSCR